jgi:hypothetical protein
MYDEVVFMEIMRENNARTVGSTWQGMALAMPKLWQNAGASFVWNGNIECVFL